MSNDEMKKLLDRVHKGITTFDYNQQKIPCIILGEKKFDEIITKVAGKPISVDTNLNILQDGLGHVFVELTLTFSEGGINEKILLNANNSVDFFELLAKTSMLALSSPHSQVGKENVFMIQLPRPEKAVNALDIIKKGLESKKESQRKTSELPSKSSELTIQECLEALDLEENATSNEIKEAYHKLTQQWHPDKHKSPERKLLAEKEMKIIIDAYKKLKQIGRVE